MDELDTLVVVDFGTVPVLHAVAYAVRLGVYPNVAVVVAFFEDGGIMVVVGGRIGESTGA